MSDQQTIAILGIGYVGLPLALAFGGAGFRVIGFDTDRDRVEELSAGRDRNEPDGGSLAVPDSVRFTADQAELSEAGVFVIAVPTPIDADRRPDLGPLVRAADTIGAVLRPGGLVVVESTVYPGATEEVVAPRLEAASGLVRGRDFKVGYSPERINPGDPTHGVSAVVKVVSAEDADALERVAALYRPIVPAGLHLAPSIRVAEACKITENIQRDVNVALMNELALIYDRLQLRTEDVLAAARTKWNFAAYTPGLVGGHCIGVDPYYLIAKAEAHGYYPELIRAARRLNDGMAERVADKIVTRLSSLGIAIAGARVGLFGLSFKENVSDARNSQSPVIARALGALGAHVLPSDPMVDPATAQRELGLQLVPAASVTDLDALILASPHAEYLREGSEALGGRVRPGGLVVDVKSALDPGRIPADRHYWSL